MTLTVVNHDPLFTTLDTYSHVLHSLEKVNQIFPVRSCIDIVVNLGNLPRFVNNDRNAFA